MANYCIYKVKKLSDGWGICLVNKDKATVMAIVARGFDTYKEAKTVADSLESDANDFAERW